jgi:hypothetical protein
MAHVTEQDVIDYLGSLEWPLTPKMFDAVLGIVPTFAFEVVIIVERKVGRKIVPHVLLLPRPESDPFFKGLVHGPGTVARRGDTEETALSRVLKEVGGKGRVSSPKFVGNVHVPKGPLPNNCPRGQEIGGVYYAVWKRKRVLEDAVIADPKNLPDHVIGFHRTMIEMAVKRYKSDRRS